MTSRTRASRIGASLALATAILPLFAPVRAQDAPRFIEATITDPAGKPVAGAQIQRVGDGPASESVQSDSFGRFVLDLEGTGAIRLSIEAPGYAPREVEISANPAPGTALSIVLTPLRPLKLNERVTVEAGRSTLTLDAEALAATAALTVDDALRQVPGFTLFRRSGSRTANPTSQGVSLRGLGGSGASRTAVLDEGVPLNDPFGGWVAWSRIPRAAIERIEVVRGGASDLYGTGALGGAIHLVRRRPEGPLALVDASYGTRGSPDASVFLGTRLGRWHPSLALESSRTDGWILVDRGERGSIDTAATSRHRTLDAMLERRGGNGGRLFVRGMAFDEDRGNGTPYQRNDTEIRQIAAGGDWPAERGALSLRAHACRQDYRQTFSSVSAGREAETPTRAQAVPSRCGGFATHWTRAMGAGHVAGAHVEMRQVSGSSREEVFTPEESFLQEVDGTQRTAALALEDSAQLSPRWSLAAGARLDRWRNLDASRDRTRIPDRAESMVSPRVALTFLPHQKLSVSASAYRAFRAPTLNELYRSFRVGNVLTQPNEELRAERLAGGELGARFASSLSVSATLFWMEIGRTIANVTVSSTPDLVTRRRENLGRTRSRGIELEAQALLGQGWSATGGWLLADSTVLDFPANHGLRGRRLPQVPRHQVALGLRRDRSGGGRLGVQVRWSAAQFEDDRNEVRLAPYAAVDVLASRRLAPGLEAFVAGENLLDARIEAGRTPVTTLASPRLVRLGLRGSWGTGSEKRAP